MQGHTDRATINQRRPLTVRMTRLLAATISAREEGLAWADLDQADRNAMRGLMDRGYATQTGAGNRERWIATEAGRALANA